MSSYYDFSSYITALTLEPALKPRAQVIHETRVAVYRNSMLRPLARGEAESMGLDLLFLLIGVPEGGE